MYKKKKKNYIKCYLFDFLIPFAYLFYLCLVIITHIFPGVLCLICRHSRHNTLSRYYKQRCGKNLNYAKKVVIFITMLIFE